MDEIRTAIRRRQTEPELVRRPENNPFLPEYRRPPRGASPEKWSPPPYADRQAEQLAGRLSKKGKKR